MKVLLFFVLAAFFIVFFVSASPPEIPVLVYGKVGYEDGSVLEGEKVTFRWYENGIQVEDSARTLTEEEAVLLGDESLKGYYSFQINSLDRGSLTVSSGGKEVTLSVGQGDVVSGDIILDKGDFISKTVDFFSGIVSGGNYSDSSSGSSGEGSLAEEPTEKSSGEESDNYYGGNFQGEEPSESSNGVPYSGSVKNELRGQEEVSGSFFESVYLFSVNNRFVFFFLGMVLFSLVLLLFIFGVKVSRKMIKKSRERMIMPLKKMASTPAKRFMNKEPIIIAPENTVMDALELFVKNNLAVIPVVGDSGIVGVVTKKSLLQKVSKEDFDSLDKLMVKRVVQKKFVSSGPGTKMADIYTLLLQHKFGAVLITKGKELMGVVDYFDILKVFNKLNIEIENPPILSQVMSEDFINVKSRTKLYQVLNTLILDDSDYALVIDDESPKGIITAKDLVSARQKNLDFKKTFAVNVMSTNLITMTPGTLLNEAFNLVLERKFNQVPIVMDNRGVGVVTVKYLVKVYYDLLSELNEKKRK